MSRARVTLSVGLALAGCRRDPPPVLFASDAGHRAPVADVALATAAVDAAAPPVRALSSAVPGDGRGLDVDGVHIVAPDGMRLGRFLALDVDGDGDRDVVATRLKPDGTAAGVRIYRRDPAAFVDLGFDGVDGPTDPACTRAELHATGTRTAVVSFVAPDGTPAPRPGTTSIVAEHVVIALFPPSVRTRVSVLAPALPDTVVEVTADTADRDGDGRDDVVATVSVRRMGERLEQGARAIAVLLDRPAGEARDVSEPEASLERAVGSVRSLLARHRGSEALAALERLDRMRLAICSEGHLARVKFGEVIGVPCGASAALRSLGELRARAFLAMGEIPAALAMFTVDGAGDRGAVTSDRLLADILRAVPAVPTVTAQAGPDEMGALAPTVRARMLSSIGLEPPFEPRQITLRGPTHGTIELATFGQYDPTPGTPDELLPRGPNGTYVLRDFIEDCAGPAVMLCLATDEACVREGALPGPVRAGVRLLRLPELPRAEHAAACITTDPAGVGTRVAVGTRVVAWGANSLVVARNGRLFKIPEGSDVALPIGRGDMTGGPFPGGCAISRDGQYTVLGMREGIFVRDVRGTWSRWMPPELAGHFGEIDDLTISNDGNTVAGVIGTHLWLIRRPPGAAAAVVH